MTSIGSFALADCTGLTGIEIPNSVTSIGDYASAGCTGLTSIEIPNSVTSIGDYAFEDCTNIGQLKWDSNVSPYCVTWYCRSNLKNVTIGNSVTSIGERAFRGCTGLTSIEIPNSVTSIGAYVFEFCNIQSVTIPNTFVALSDVVNVDNLKTLNINIVDWSFYNNSISKFKKSTIAVHYYCDSKEITGDYVIPSYVTKLGDYILENCSSLTSVSIPSSVTNIGYGSFSGCSALSSIVIPNSVTDIGDYAFRGCSSLSSIEIPASVSSIGTNTFYGCNQLKKVTINSNTLLSKDYSSYYSYRLYDCFGNQVEELIIGESVSSIGNYAFYNGTSSSSKIKSITLPNSVKTVGDYAFYGHDLTSLHMSNNIEYIGCNAFNLNNLITIQQTDNTYTSVTFKVDNKITGDSDITTMVNGITPNKKGIITIEDLCPGHSYSSDFIALCNNSPIDWWGVSYNTKSFQPQIEVIQTGPTNIKVSGSYINDEGYNVRSGFYDPKTRMFVEGDSYNYDNLRPYKYYDDYRIEYRIYVSDDKYESESIYAYTQSLTLQTVNPKVTTNTSAVVSAQTNISDEETHVGFEWRKIDAPDVIPSKSGAAVIYDGLMEGQIKGLDSNTYYKVRPYYEAYDGTRYYGEWIGFDPSDFSYFEPTVHTYDLPTEPTDNSVKVRGYAVAGTDNIEAQGFEYWPSNSPMEGETVSATGQAMTATLNGLRYNTEYTVRAFVSTSAKTVYGESIKFNTPVDNGVEKIASDENSINNRKIGVFDTYGRLINSSPNADLSTLKQGVYIINGKKVYVK